MAKKYLEVAEGNATHLKVEVYYSKGGMNYFTSTNEARGLYLSVSPVTRSGNWESYTGFSGIKKHLLSMERFNQKKLDTCIVDEAYEQELIKYVCEKNNIILKKDLVDTN
jgi:hypothetical protein